MTMATKKELLTQAQERLEKFFSLCALLLGEDAPYNVNELAQDSQWYDDMKELSDEMELDWENMSHEDSNRVVINALADKYCLINEVEGYKPLLTISFKKEG